MKITKTQIRRIIREELNRVLSEIRDVPGEEFASAMSGDFPEGAFTAGEADYFGPDSFIEAFAQEHPELAEKFGSLDQFEQFRKSWKRMFKDPAGRKERLKFKTEQDYVDWIVADMARAFSRRTPAPQTHAELSALGIENIPRESRGMFMPGKFMHTFLNKPGNEGITPERAMELWDQSFDAMKRLPRAEFRRLRQSKPEMMQWTMDKMQELA